MNSFRLVVASAVAILYMAAPAAAGVITPQSGWYAGNPLLGPNSLSDLACAGPTCYASGAFGTVLKSTDSGSSWNGIVTGLTQDLGEVRLIGGDPGKIITGGGCALRRSDDGGETFNRLPFTASDLTCPSQVASFSFPNSNEGYIALVDGSVYFTSDGGQSFSRRTAIPGVGAGRDATDLRCTSPSTCFAVGTSGTVQRTTDSGNSWTQVSQAGAPLFAVFFADATTGYAVGSALRVLKTTDGGETWEPLEVIGVPGGDLTKVRCVNAQLCLASTGQGNQVLRTTDGGETWTSVVTSTDPTFAADFSSETRAVAVGDSGTAAVSDDGGATWKSIGSRLPGNYRLIRGVSPTVAFAGGEQGVLARTIDAGQSWTNVSPPTSAAIRDVGAADERTIFVLDSAGGLQRSTNGGASYSILNPGAVSGPQRVAGLGSDRVVLMGARGVAVSSDNGNHFTAVRLPLRRSDRLASIDLAGQALFARGSRLLIVSADSGATWSRVRLPRLARGERVSDADFVSARLGFVRLSSGEIWKTRDGGRRWVEVLSTGNLVTFRDMVFSSPQNGYVAGAMYGGDLGLGRQTLIGVVLRTSDGGATWRPQIVSERELRAISTGGSTDYALAGDGFLYATRSGGDVGAPSALRLRSSARRVRKNRTVTIAGTLAPAEGGERVAVFRRSGGRWSRQEVTVAANGSFTTRWRITRNALFVAQVLGDADHAGTGTPPLFVNVRR